MHNFTPNDLLLYIAGEMPKIEEKAMQQALCLDNKLFAYYQATLESWEEASSFILNPSENFTNRLFQRLEKESLVAVI